MPGNVSLATAVEVLPIEYSAAFSEELAWPIIESGPYADGRSQRRADATVARHAWVVSKRLTADQWDDLINFFEARYGSLEAFYFYPDLNDHDATGVSTTGRYTVRFDGGLSRTMELARCSSELRLIEIA